MPGQRGALKELDYGPPARRIGDVSAGAQNTYVEAAYRIASPARGLTSGRPAAPCRSAECKEHLAKTQHIVRQGGSESDCHVPGKGRLSFLN